MEIEPEGKETKVNIVVNLENFGTWLYEPPETPLKLMLRAMMKSEKSPKLIVKPMGFGWN